MPHPIDEHKLPGIGPGRIKRLKAAGLHSLEDLVQAGAHAVGAIPHIPADIARDAVDAAAAVLGALAPEAAVDAPAAEPSPVSEPAPVVEAAPEPTPVAEAAPEPAPAPAPAPDPVGAAPAADAGMDDAPGLSKRLLGQLDETLMRLIPGPWGRLREHARRLRS